MPSTLMVGADQTAGGAPSREAVSQSRAKQSRRTPMSNTLANNGRRHGASRPRRGRSPTTPCTKLQCAPQLEPHRPFPASARRRASTQPGAGPGSAEFASSCGPRRGWHGAREGRRHTPVRRAQRCVAPLSRRRAGPCMIALCSTECGALPNLCSRRRMLAKSRASSDATPRRGPAKAQRVVPTGQGPNGAPKNPL